MKIEDADQLERQFNISFPERYKEAITIAYPFEEQALELESSAAELKLENEEYRKDDPWEFKWETHYWFIGCDGAGGFYFIDTKAGEDTVYYIDHEAPAKDISDVENFSSQSFEDFIADNLALEAEMKVWEDKMRVKVQNRAWWQFWIPKQWPPKPKS